MKLEELIKTNNWLSVELTLLNLYPDQEKNIDAYRRVYALIREMVSLRSEIEIIIEQGIDEETGEPGMGNVYGIDHESEDEITNAVALEFTPWGEWMGMKISERVLKKFTELKIIAHCLYEMTFAGYDEEEIQDEFSKIKKIKDEYENLSPEEKERRTTSLDDWLKDLDDEDNENNEV